MQFDVIVIDVEVKKGFKRCKDVFKFGASMGCMFSYKMKKYYFFDEDNIGQMIDLMHQADLVVGYNLYRYDYCVLAPYSKSMSDIFRLPTFDLMQHTYTLASKRIRMENMAKQTLGFQKSAYQNLNSIELYEQGRLIELQSYIKNDVWLAQQLFNTGCRLGELHYWDGDDGKLRKINTSQWRDLARSIAESNWKP